MDSEFHCTYVGTDGKKLKTELMTVLIIGVWSILCLNGYSVSLVIFLTCMITRVSTYSVCVCMCVCACVDSFIMKKKTKQKVYLRCGYYNMQLSTSQ